MSASILSAHREAMLGGPSVNVLHRFVCMPAEIASRRGYAERTEALRRQAVAAANIEEPRRARIKGARP